LKNQAHILFKSFSGVRQRGPGSGSQLEPLGNGKLPIGEFISFSHKLSVGEVYGGGLDENEAKAFLSSYHVPVDLTHLYELPK
jgi:hypothetical protein